MRASWSILLSGLLLSTALAQPPRPEKAPGFGAPQGQRPLPGFGKHTFRHLPIVDADRNNARAAIQKVDTNRDGVMTRTELRNSRYSKYEAKRFMNDWNRDDRLTVDELAVYYAQIRINKNRQAAKKSGSKVVVSTRSPSRHFSRSFEVASFHHAAQSDLRVALARSGKTQRWMLLSDAKGRVTAVSNEQLQAIQSLNALYDLNANGVLEEKEWRRIPGELEKADRNQDGKLALDELLLWTSQLRGETAATSDWFVERDKNQDGQVTMAEFAFVWTPEKLTEFQRYDRNGDGLITAAERQTPTKSGRRYSGRSTVLGPGLDGVSRLSISDDFPVGRVTVQLSISHQVPQELDVFLVSPDGRQVRLFTGVGKKWKGQHLMQTVFEDSAKVTMEKSAPPFKGRFKPDGPQTLASFVGASSKGVWELRIAGKRNLRAGFLDGWSLVLEPQ